MYVGTWDGRSWLEIERDDGAALSAWMSRWAEERTPDGESFGDVIERTRHWLVDVVQAARRDGVPQLAVVAHAGSICALISFAIGLPRSLAFPTAIRSRAIECVASDGERDAPHVFSGRGVLSQRGSRAGLRPVKLGSLTIELARACRYAGATQLDADESVRILGEPHSENLECRW
jgi:hypothetical protein